jgi:predicted nucleic acid-binding protein
MSVVLDTCILIDVLRLRPAAVAYIESLSERPAISVVTVTELRAGQRSMKEARQIDQMLGHMTVIPVSAAVAELAGDMLRNFRKSHSVDVPDALIAGTAVEVNLPLATLNLKHFPMFPHLKAPY